MTKRTKVLVEVLQKLRRLESMAQKVDELIEKHDLGILDIRN